MKETCLCAISLKGQYFFSNKNNKGNAVYHNETDWFIPTNNENTFSKKLP